MNVTIENNELVIRIPLQAPTRSASGKTYVVASSHGNQPTKAQIDHDGIKKNIIVGLNAYVK